MRTEAEEHRSIKTVLSANNIHRAAQNNRLVVLLFLCCMKKILVFLGHPDPDTYSGHVADAYESTAREAGHEVVRVNISDLNFDPILHMGYKHIQELEPDLKDLQDKIIWADHIVFVYPNWWVSMPAVMKGLFDRMWLPGFAFNFDKVTKKVIQRLVGKTARIIIICGTHTPFMTWWKFGDYTNELAHGILGFAGIKARVSAYGPSERVAPEVLEKWIHTVEEYGRYGV